MISRKFKKNHSLSDLTTFRIGGPASYFLTAANNGELRDALMWSRDNGFPWFVLGGGSNLLISDEGFPGLVVRLGKDFSSIEISEKDGTVSAGGAVKLPALSSKLVKEGWGGLEFLSGIPGTVGGAVRMNAGTRDGEIKDRFISTEVLTTELENATYKGDEMGFSYRHSRLAEDGGIVINAVFGLGPRSSPSELGNKVREMILSRKDVQPANNMNCGSVFKNPRGMKPAAWYIQRAGLKGLRVGDAIVSEEHANWIVNLGNASASDVRDLISNIQEIVLEEHGVELEREVICIPEDVT
jgi:UDP-N-acetylmuramate dehydrogenase